MKFFLLALSIFIFASCSSIKNARVKKEKDNIISFTSYENPFKKQFTRISKEKFKPTKELESYNLSDNNLKYFIARGYTIIGMSKFVSTYFSRQKAVNAGCGYGALILLYRYDYYGTAEGTTVGRLSNGDSKEYTMTSKSSGSYSGIGSNSYSSIGNNGYAFGYGSSTINGNSSSETITKITDPGSFSYYAVPYEINYYKQQAVYLAKKFYWLDKLAIIYENPSLKGKFTSLDKGRFFEILNWCKEKNSMKIKMQNKYYYLPCSTLEYIGIH